MSEGYLYIVGGVVVTSPMGLNPQDMVEEFGSDFAVKPIVGTPRVRRRGRLPPRSQRYDLPLPFRRDRQQRCFRLG